MIILNEDRTLLNNKNKTLVRYYKNLTLDLNTISAFISNERLELTLIEYKILLILIDSTSELVARQKIIDFVWPKTVVAEKTLNTHLTNLRAKLKPAGIEFKNIKNVGISLI